MEYLTYAKAATGDLHAGTPESPRTLCGKPVEDFETLPGVAEEWETDERWCRLCADALRDMGARPDQ